MSNRCRMAELRSGVRWWSPVRLQPEVSAPRTAHLPVSSSSLRPSSPSLLFSSSTPHPVAANCISARRHCHTPIRWGKFFSFFFASLFFVGVTFLWCDPNTWKSLAAARTKPSAPLLLLLFLLQAQTHPLHPVAYVFIYSLQPCQTLFHKSKLNNGWYVYFFFKIVFWIKIVKCNIKVTARRQCWAKKTKPQLFRNNRKNRWKPFNTVYWSYKAVQQYLCWNTEHVNSFMMFFTGWKSQS